MRSHISMENSLKVLLSGIILWLFISPADSQDIPKVRIAMMGNSITYGATLANPAEQSYPAQLSLMLSEVYGDSCEILNCGVSGRTMMRSAESPLWIEAAFANGLKFVPDICVIALGTNDSKPYRWEAWGDEFLDDYRAMIDTFKYRNPNTRFIVCYPPPIWPGHPYGTEWSNLHNDTLMVNEVFPAIDTIVEEKGAILVDFHTPFIDSVHLFPDLLHPGVEGSRQMAEILFDMMIDSNLIGQVDAEQAYISDFKQSISPVSVGSKVELKWSTIFADEVWLDDVVVGLSGTQEVIAEAEKVYTLTVKGPNNTSVYQLNLNTYVPTPKGLKITTSSNDYRDGYMVTLYSTYLDQVGRVMDENTSNISWTIVEGEGDFQGQTDTSIVFIPTVVGKAVVEASTGDLSAQKSLSVYSLPSAVQSSAFKTLKVYPNPVGDALYLQVNSIRTETITVRIYDVLGAQLAEKSVTLPGEVLSEIALNTSELNSGVYTYSIHAGTKASYGRFLKK